MSINVTVHGNPISIKRGRMVAVDADKEFELRRRIRLQQVRQQSKEIAEEVRNRVRKEKNKQLSKIDKKSERDLKRLQERKLATLQKQYQECLEEFGAAYKDADKQIESAKMIEQIAERNRNLAELRGKIAAEKQRGEKEQREKEIQQSINQKKEARKLENVRSKLVTNIQKNKKKSPRKCKRRKNCIADITINGVSTIVSDESDDAYSSDLGNLSVLDESSLQESPEHQSKSSKNTSLDSEGNSIYTISNESPKENRQEASIESWRDFNMDEEKTSITNSKPQKQSVGVKQSVKSEKINEKKERKDDSSILDGKLGNQQILTQNAKVDEEKTPDRDSYKSHKNIYTIYTVEKDAGLFLQPTRSIHKIHKTSEDVVDQKPAISSRVKQFIKIYEQDKKSKLELEHTSQGEKEWQKPILNEKNQMHSTRTHAARISARVRKSLEDADEESVLVHENKNVQANGIPTRNRRLQSGLDGEDYSSPYLRKIINFYDENNCPIFPKDKDKKSPRSKNKSIKPVKKGKSSKTIHSAKSPNLRKTIRSLKTDRTKSKPSTDTLFSSVSEAGDANNSTKYVWSSNPVFKRSPKKHIKSPNKMTATVCFCPHNKENHLPYVPTTAIGPESVDTQDSTVRYYDHFNRFQKEKNQPTLVQKISEESLKVYPPSDEEEKYKEQLKRWDEEAKIRGNRALEKNKIQRDYQQLMEELPVLQRQERLAAMMTHNPAYHMSQERYKEYERKKQNRMENLYESLSANPGTIDTPIITLKSVRKSPPSTNMKQPFKTLDISDSTAPVLNVGHWENVESSTSSITQVSRDDTPTDESVDKEVALADLLKRVNKQREILLKEAATLPSLASLKSVLKENELFELLGKTQPQTRVLVETGTSPLVTKDSDVAKKVKKVKPTGSKVSFKRAASTTSSSDTSVETPKQKTKKGKVHKKVKVVLKEEGTQTTPPVAKSEETTTKDIEEEKMEESTQTVPCPSGVAKICLCPKDKSLQTVTDKPEAVNQVTQFPSGSESDKVCEIIIKTGEESSVQISSTPYGTTEKLSTRSATSEGSIYKKQGKFKAPVVQIKIKESDEKLVSDEFVPRNMLEMSTSTSYMSPPTDSGKKLDRRSVYTSTFPVSDTSTNKDLLMQPHKQQTNLDNLVRVEQGTKEVNPRLVKYIKRLLSMSRQSIDELTVSSVSDVSTPQDSIVQTASNLAREKLQSVMDHFNLSLGDIKKYYLSSSSFSMSNMSSDTTPERNLSNQTCPAAVQTQRLYQNMKQTESQDTYTEKLICAISPEHCTSMSTSTDFTGDSVKMPRQKVLETRATTLRIENKGFVNETQPITETGPTYSVERSTSPICFDILQETKTEMSTQDENETVEVATQVESKKAEVSVQVGRKVEAVTQSGTRKIEASTQCEYQRKPKSVKKVTIDSSLSQIRSASPGYSRTSATAIYKQVHSGGAVDEFPVSAYQEVTSQSPREMYEQLVSSLCKNVKPKSPTRPANEPPTSTSYQKVQPVSTDDITSPVYQRIQPRSPRKITGEPSVCAPRTRFSPRSPDRAAEESSVPTSYQMTQPKSPSGQSLSPAYQRVYSRSPNRTLDESLPTVDSSQVLEIIPCPYYKSMSPTRTLGEPSTSTGYQDMALASPRRESAEASVSTGYQRVAFRPESPNAGSNDPSTSTDYKHLHPKNVRVSFESQATKKFLQRPSAKEYKRSSSSTGKEASTSSDTEPHIVIHTRSPRKESSDSTDNEKCLLRLDSKDIDRSRTTEKQTSSTRDCQPSEEFSYTTEHYIHPQKDSGIKKPISPKGDTYKQTTKSPPSKLGLAQTELSTDSKIPVSPESILSNEVQQENFLQFVRDSLGMSVEEFTELGFEEMFTRHMQLTEYCHDRIRSLMDLIEKVRNEKKKIFTPSPVDQSMTSYLELPQIKTTPQNESAKNAEATEKDYSSDTTSSMSQGMLEDYLLTVDPNDSRLNKHKKHVTYKPSAVSHESTQSVNESQETFVPMLQGIPKYVESETSSRQPPSYIKGIIQHLKQKPPPSLLRSNMRGQTDVTPHELSTIVEADTIASSRNTSMHHAPSPETKKTTGGISPHRDKKSISPNRANANQSQEDDAAPAQVLESACKCSNHSDSGDYITITPDRSITSDRGTKQQPQVEASSSFKNPMNSSVKSTSTTTDEVKAKSSMSGVLPLTTDSTIDSPDELESMLRKFKLEWAIALVKKTEQALALSSSSSASDVQANTGRLDKNSSDSYQRLCQKLGSTSSIESDKSHIFMDLSHNFREFQDISGIQGIIERSRGQQQRTSTPVQHSKSSESKKSAMKDNLFRNDSEISSVRNSSEDNLFLSIPNLTLNTTNCSLNKSKK